MKGKRSEEGREGKREEKGKGEVQVKPTPVGCRQQTKAGSLCLSVSLSVPVCLSLRVCVREKETKGIKVTTGTANRNRAGFLDFAPNLQLGMRSRISRHVFVGVIVGLAERGALPWDKCTGIVHTGGQTGVTLKKHAHKIIDNTP